MAMAIDGYLDKTLDSQASIKPNGSDPEIGAAIYENNFIADDFEGGTGKETGKAAGLCQKRVFMNGCLLVPLAIFIAAFSILCVFAIVIPTTYMGLGPILAQKSVEHTVITLHNIRITDWAFTQNGTEDTCAQYFPSTLTVTQDILFSNIPWYGQMGSTYIRPAVLDLTFNGTKFAELYLPQVDLSHPTDNAKFANDTVGTMKITNQTGFVLANAELLPLGGTLLTGWTIWHQAGDVVLQVDLLGITSYYSAFMSQDVNVSHPVFLDGPITTIEDNMFDALICLNPVANPGSSGASL